MHKNFRTTSKSENNMQNSDGMHHLTLKSENHMQNSDGMQKN
jgi:hypothetical protein